MIDLTDYTVIKKLLVKHNFRFSKALGQNFLVDPTVCPQMAELAGIDRDTCVIEIGAGIGVLTVELAKRAKKVVTFEVDARLIPVLAETLDGLANTEVVCLDVTKTDLPAFFAERFAGERVCVCANLPYYITSPVLMLLLESRLPLSTVTVMVQKEAAERICAGVGQKNSGALTAAVCYYAEPHYLFDVGRDSFLPSPHVDSAVIRLDIRERPPVEVRDERFFFRTIRAAFAQRRKTAVNSLSSGLALDRAVVSEALTAVGLSPTARAETFTLAQFASLADTLLAENSVEC